MADDTRFPGPPPARDGDAVDARLVRAVAGGDPGALEALYARHGLRLLSYLAGQVGDRALAEEVLQDVMLAVWRGASNFRGDCRVTTWLLAIARRRAISARQGRAPAHAPLSDQFPTGDTGPQEALERRADRDAVRAALDRLPADQRETLELVFYHGLSGPEAAEVLGIAPGTVKSRLHRAKRHLERLLRLGEAMDEH